MAFCITMDKYIALASNCHTLQVQSNVLMLTLIIVLVEYSISVEPLCEENIFKWKYQTEDPNLGCYAVPSVK